MSIFRRGPDRKDVEAQLESVRGLVEILKLSRANLDAADACLAEADVALARDDLGRAKAHADRAEGIATALEADYRAATEAVEKLRAYVAGMKALGIAADAEEAALEAVHARATSTRELEGRGVPDYAGARAVAEEAWTRAEGRQALHDRAGDAIFAAELAVAGASEGLIQPAEALREAGQLLEKAQGELTRGYFELAATDAAVAEKLALGVVDQRRRAQETMVSVEKVLAGLKGIGVPVGPIARSLEMGRTLVAKGKLVAAIEVFNEAAQEAVQLGTSYRQLLDSFTQATKAIEALRSEGLPTAEAEGVLARAKAAARAGNLALAQACCDDVHLAIRRQREMREDLRRWLDETKAHVANLHELGLELVNDVKEMVAKAEQKFVNSDYAAATEDLRIAALLLKPALNGRVRDGPEIAR